VRVKRLVARALRPTALISGGFLAITAAIVVNAAFLQSGRHPAPLFDTRHAPELPARRDARVEAVQAALRDVGYYAGPLDGIAGEQTKAAIAAYERKLGWAPTGAASRDLLTAIKAAASAPPAPPEAITMGLIAPAAAAPDKQVAAVQDALAKAAYGPVRADGVFGRQTRDAIVRFQQDHGLPITGEISDALIVELRAAGALDDE
jgi:peptidoglycan hydrolase-like protein with peptidoglycan-binding domain